MSLLKQLIQTFDDFMLVCLLNFGPLFLSAVFLVVEAGGSQLTVIAQR